MGIRKSCYCKIAVLVSCKNTVKLIYVTAKYKCSYKWRSVCCLRFLRQRLRDKKNDKQGGKNNHT